MLTGRRPKSIPPSRPTFSRRQASASDDRDDRWLSWDREADYRSSHDEDRDPWEDEDDEPYVPSSQPAGEAMIRPRWMAALATSWQAGRL
jgi:hypothetical protein